MKKMTCKQLGGACDLEFKGNTFEEIEAQSKAHGMDMFKRKDKAHLEAMNKMRSLMHDPEAFEKWYKERRSEFDAL